MRHSAALGLKFLVNCNCPEPHWNCLTSGFNLPDTHVHYHRPLGNVSFHERCKVATVHLLDMFQVWLTVIRDHLGALLMNIQTTIWKKKMRYYFKSSEHSGLFVLAKDTPAWMRFKRGLASRSSCRVGKHFSYLFSWKILVLSQKTKLLAHASSLTCCMISGHYQPKPSQTKLRSV